MGTRASLTMTPADILRYQNDLVRTGKYLPLGRMQKISIGPTQTFTPPASDPYIRKFGRLIDLRNRFLPIAQSPDRMMILVTAPLVGRDNRVSLPDVPDPDWAPGAWTREELEGREVEKNGARIRMPVERPLEKDTARMIPQRLEDRTNEILEGTNFLVFAPVINVAFQPEIENRLVGTAWTIQCGFNPADRTHTSLLIDRATGETHFFGGLYDIAGPEGE
jgi:hypothetical protein